MERKTHCQVVLKRFEGLCGLDFGEAQGFNQIIRARICRGGAVGEAKREAPAQAELRPTCAGASPADWSTCPIKLALMGSQPGNEHPEWRSQGTTR
jgi:hypothetical protein